MKKKKRRSFAGRLTRRIVTWLLVILAFLTFWIGLFSYIIIEHYYSFSYHQSMRVTSEYTRRILSDVHVAIQNNTYEIERTIDQPDQLQGLLERIVRQNPRIRSCGISFIENYYPKKGRSFCPYAWRSGEGEQQEVKSMVMRGEETNYLDSEWFTETLAADSLCWSKPFFDGHEATQPMVAELVPIHDRQGRPVAVLGVDVSLDWLTRKLGEIDSLSNLKQALGKNRGSNGQVNSYSCIISRDGTYIVHPDVKRILKDNIFNHVKPWIEDDSVAIDSLRLAIQMGWESRKENLDRYYVDGPMGFLFFMPVKHTDWMVVTFVNWKAIAIPGFASTIFLLCTIFVSVIVLYVVCKRTVKRVTKPLRQLAKSADEVAKGNFDASLPELKHNDEIMLLRDSFENMQQSLSKYIEELTTTTASKSAIENELKIAHDIQMSMLPKTFPPFPNRSDLDIFGRLTPAKAVGGDLFDFFIREERLFFCIGDVSGKGVPASLVMAVTRSLFRNISAHESKPDLIVKAINDSLASGNESNMFVTLFVGVLHLPTGILHYCNAGHDAPLLIGRNVIPLAVESNIPAGVMAEWQFSEQQADLTSGTTIFLYTDGLTEAEDATHAQFGEERMLEVARQTITRKPTDAMQLIDQMTSAVRAFVGDAEQSDDLTMLAIKITY